MIWLIIIGSICFCVVMGLLIFLLKRSLQIDTRLQERDRSGQDILDSITKNQMCSLNFLQESIQKNMADVRSQVTNVIDNFTDRTNKNLHEISGQVEQRLTDGFAKTTSVFTDVVKRLALIDEAQKKITDLSNNVMDLQEILADKRSRGAFGEIQLTALIRNMLPENHFSLQHTLSNGTRCDCILFLPEPTGNVVIDAKFPLESYKKLIAPNLSEADKRLIEQQFRTDIKKHLQDIAGKYVISGETSDGAMMFIPAEAVFAEIHSHFSDLVELSHKLHVWIVSPTTLMAVLTTARAVLKDVATRKQIHIIQEHLRYLNQDFARFQERMDKLKTHIDQAQKDVDDIHISSKKITGRFSKIEQVELIEN